MTAKNLDLDIITKVVLRIQSVPFQHVPQVQRNKYFYRSCSLLTFRYWLENWIEYRFMILTYLYSLKFC